MTARTIADPRPALVGIDGQTHDDAQGNLWGYAAHVSEWRWNGWAVPFFTHAEVERIADQARVFNADLSPEWLLDSGCKEWTWDAQRGVWLERDPRYPEEPATVCEPSHLPDGTPVYALGDGFCWSESERAPLALAPEAREAWEDGTRAVWWASSPMTRAEVERWAFDFVNDPDTDDDVHQGTMAAWIAGALSTRMVAA